MKFSPLFASAFILLSVLAFSTSVAAQSLDEKWNRVTPLSTGTKLVVEADGRKPVKGKLVQATETSLTLRTGGKDVAIPRQDISAVFLGKGSSKIKRGLIGALAGAGAGVLIGGIAAAAGADPLVAAGGFLFGIPAGAAVGVATSGGTKKGSLIYAR